jgi:hypothetical protein
VADRRLRFCALATCALAVVLVAALIGVLIALEVGPYKPQYSRVGEALDLATAIACLAVGAVVTPRHPRNLVGWAVLLMGSAFLVGDLADRYAELALLAHPGAGLPGGTAAVAFGAGSWTLLMAFVFVLLLVFPSGRLDSPRLRLWAGSVLSGFAAIWFLISTDPGREDAPFHRFKNPLAFVSDRHYLLLAIPIIVACLLSVAAAVVIAVRRFRRSRGVERHQFKWLAASGVLLVIGLPISAASSQSALSGIPLSLALIALPLSLGVAVTRHGLYEIDRLIRRTVSYVIVTGLLAAVFISIVVLSTRVLPFSSPVATAASTLAVAALFNPLRRRSQQIVDRRFNRGRYDAETTVGAFSLGLRHAIDPDEINALLAQTVTQALEPGQLSIWTRNP